MFIAGCGEGEGRHERLPSSTAGPLVSSPLPTTTTTWLRGGPSPPLLAARARTPAHGIPDIPLPAFPNYSKTVKGGERYRLG